MSAEDINISDTEDKIEFVVNEQNSIINVNVIENANVDININQTTIKQSINVTDEPVIVEINVSEGKDGKDALNNIVKHDYQGSYSFIGIAPEGSGETDNVWTITRIEILSDGTTDKIIFKNVKWSDILILF